MRKIAFLLALALIAAATFGLVSCGGDEEPTEVVDTAIENQISEYKSNLSDPIYTMEGYSYEKFEGADAAGAWLTKANAGSYASSVDYIIETFNPNSGVYVGMAIIVCKSESAAASLAIDAEGIKNYFKGELGELNGGSTMYGLNSRQDGKIVLVGSDVTIRSALGEEQLLKDVEEFARECIEETFASLFVIDSLTFSSIVPTRFYDQFEIEAYIKVHAASTGNSADTNLYPTVKYNRTTGAFELVSKEN